jgi:sterol desaturase/sphingolipid hydroxylase (fatty acid hydroxylase superfamily)
MAQAVQPPETKDPVPLPAAAARFVRADHLEPGYVAGRHIALTLTLASIIAAGGVLLALRARPIDWLVAPAFFIVANLIEWTVHKYPMHHPLPPHILYKNHTLIHHLAFTNRNMPITRTSELGLVMMPWYTMLGLFVFASPVMIVAGLLRGPGLAGVFLLAAVAYFLMYEVLHASYHLPDAVLNRIGVGRLRLYRAAQAHHRHHHVLTRMSHVNFNVTFPLMDRLLGTFEKEPSKGS